jgi:hypothetical protein
MTMTLLRIIGIGRQVVYELKTEWARWLSYVYLMMTLAMGRPLCGRAQFMPE